MGKSTITKRLSSVSQSTTSQSIDTKARRRIEELYELTDEIINAYNEINEKYVNQIYRKYKRLQERHKKLKEKLTNHHCSGCKCSIQSNDNDDEEEEEEEDNEEESDHSNEDDEQTKNSALPSSTTNSSITRTKKKNPFIISDVEDTQIFDANDNGFDHNMSDDDDEDDGDKTPMDTKGKATKNDMESDEEVDENNTDEDNGMARLPLALQIVIKNKARRNKNAKLYLLQIPRYPALCEFLRDKSRTSFDHRPSEDQVRPLIEKHLGHHLANDSKMRMRLRDELREIHRSYMRTFMNDPHASTMKNNKQINVKKSPM